MFGEDIGTLNVKLEFADGETTTLVTIAGEQANAWLLSSHTVTTYSPARLLVEGVAGEGKRGDISLDDFSLGLGSCPSHVRNNFYMNCFCIY